MEQYDETNIASNDKYIFAAIGPVYTADSVKQMLHIDDAELAGLIVRHDILVVTSGDGDTRYPQFQFGDNSTLLPHLREAFAELDKLGLDPWWVAMRLNDKVAVWGDRSAAELLRTVHATEVLRQLLWPAVPLGQRAENERNMAIARPIADRVIELVADIPSAQLHRGTLFVTNERPEPLAVAAVTFEGLSGVYPIHYSLTGDPEDTARTLADAIRRTAAKGDARGASHLDFAARRQIAAESAHNAYLAGVHADADYEADSQEWVDGQITLDQLLERARRRHLK